MDFILELLFELFVEGTLELSKNIKVPKTIRYPLLGLIILFVIAVIVGIFVLGIALFTEDMFFSIMMFALGAFFLVGISIKTYKFFKNKKLD
ncbi:MAG: hypothetical protein IIT39_01980 [Clostridia bacterium]|nr:hypothetical protein [Clostridia bacterium]